MEIHLGESQNESAFAALPALHGAGIKKRGAATDLGHTKIKGSEPGVEVAGFEAVGVAVAAGHALIRSGSQMPLMFEKHGVVDQETHGLGQILKAIGGKGVEDLGG